MKGNADNCPPAPDTYLLYAGEDDWCTFYFGLYIDGTIIHKRVTEAIGDIVNYWINFNKDSCDFYDISTFKIEKYTHNVIMSKMFVPLIISEDCHSLFISNTGSLFYSPESSSVLKLIGAVDGKGELHEIDPQAFIHEIIDANNPPPSKESTPDSINHNYYHSRGIYCPHCGSSNVRNVASTIDTIIYGPDIWCSDCKRSIKQ